jgi:hypothetical protein
MPDADFDGYEFVIAEACYYGSEDRPNMEAGASDLSDAILARNKAIEEKFGVHVLAVRTIKMKGATKYIRGTRRTKKESNRKKAYVTVKAGERIEQV